MAPEDVGLHLTTGPLELQTTSPALLAGLARRNAASILMPEEMGAVLHLTTGPGMVGTVDQAARLDLLTDENARGKGAVGFEVKDCTVRVHLTTALGIVELETGAQTDAGMRALQHLGAPEDAVSLRLNIGVGAVDQIQD